MTHPDDRGLVLVTGASGFVGAAVARALLAAGHPVRALARPTSPRANLDALGVEVALGDIRDPAAVAAAMAGARHLVHVAADYRLWARRPEEMADSNVAGTRVVMEAALAAGLSRVVHTSSVATLRLNEDGRPADESGPLRESEAIGAYKASKVGAERLVEGLVRERGLPAVIVNPSTPVGPGDVKPTPTGRLVLEAARGRVPAFVDTGLNFAHVDDVARGHVLALHRGRVGERYILGGQDATLAELLAVVARLTGRRPPTVRLPRAVAYPIAAVSEAIAHLTGRAPLATLDGVRMSRHRMFFTSAKAEAELGYAARPYAEGLADAVAWFRGAGMLPAAPGAAA